MNTEKEIIQKEESNEMDAFPFKKKNYMLMLSGIGALILGFIIMSIDGDEFGFGFLGLTLGPIIVFAGFMIEIWAILYKEKESK